MEDERLKAGVGLRHTMNTQDERSSDYDAKVKNLFKFRAILAVVLHLVIPEYKECSLQEVIECIEPSSISDSTAVTEGETVRSENSESTIEDEKQIFFDLKFLTRIPKSNDSVKVSLVFDLEVQKKVKNLKYKLEHRGIYYMSRLLSSQLNYVTEETDYDQLKKVYSIWICTSDIAEMEENSIVRYQIVGKKLYGKEFPVPEADLAELIVVKLGNSIEFIPNDAKSEDDILEFLYGTLAYNQHKEYFEKYIDMNNVEDGEKIRKELSAMSGAGDLLVNDTIKANSMEIAKGLIALGKNTLEEIASVTRLPLDVIKNLAKPKAQQQ